MISTVGKNLFVLLIAFCLVTPAYSQYWQQEVNYKIDVSLDDREHTLKGFETIVYVNHSPDTLHFIWFHLWPNAYKNDRTAMTDQMLENGNTKFYFSDKEQKGYINRLDFKVDNVTARVEDHPEHIDIVKVYLSKPLLPGQRTTITTPFNVKLPYNFSRGGHDGQSYQVTQWYPKPAVYDRNGWHPMTYLDQGEFYSEFGSFEVKITVPSNYVVAATGSLQNLEEIEWLEKKAMEAGSPGTKNSSEKTDPFPESSKEIKILHFRQNRIHDFAWFADKRFIVNHDTCLLASGKIIDVYTYYTPSQAKIWSNSVQFAKDAVKHYSNLVGEYPYEAVSVVQGPESFGGGMEYPMITVISPLKDDGQIDRTIAHEIGHNWFYGILASNERAHPWMDEGLNNYYESLYTQKKYEGHHEGERFILETAAAMRTDQPISLPSEKFSELNYYNIAYYKTSEWLHYLESQLGSESFHAAMRYYFDKWKFRHPQPSDFKAALETSTGKNLDTLFAYLDKTGTLPHQQKTGTRYMLVFDAKSMQKYLQNPSKNLVTIGPALGVNYYDKLMGGVFVTNYKLPPSAFQYFIAPMYGTGSGEFVGIGSLAYTFFPDGIFRKIRLHLNASRFSMDDFQSGDQPEVHLSVTKISPDIKFTFRNRDPRSHFNRYIRLKSYFLDEEFLSFYRDTTISGPDTTITSKYREKSENRILNQLSFVIENNRVLYPYRGELKIEQGEDFARLAFTGNYFFNYPKEGGLQARLFAGKFIYTSSKTFAKQFSTDRYHLNMTGPNGYEDYIYNDYFIGRNEFEGLSSQQIMIRDGAFKVRTDLLAAKVGRTDDWLAAINLSTTIPSGLNPLTMLPVKIPLKIFLDIGTYAETWEQGAEEDRFLFDAGLQIPLFLETVNIYIPLVYSKVYKDYIQSTLPKKGRLWKTLSFSIDISSFHPRKIDRRFTF